MVFEKIQSFGINRPSGSVQEFWFIIMLFDCDCSQLKIRLERHIKCSAIFTILGDKITV